MSQGSMESYVSFGEKKFLAFQGDINYYQMVTRLGKTDSSQSS